VQLYHHSLTRLDCAVISHVKLKAMYEQWKRYYRAISINISFRKQKMVHPTLFSAGQSSQVTLSNVVSQLSIMSAVQKQMLLFRKPLGYCETLPATYRIYWTF